uniref:Uncharacterized protein n=1 Tax=Ananas comosus var. bracteatus TaxID=296719 RepID=A0A6V7PEE0_ANACO|nr:unnamed protein product [Ananas comosus var. bracteatus]
MDLVTYAEELLDSDLSDEQLDGAQILQNFVESDDYAFDTLRKIGTSRKVMERLIEMLNWKNLAEEDIRRCAAEIVKMLAGKKQNMLRVAGIPGSMESVSSLLHTERSTTERSSRTDQSSTTTAEETNYDFSSFNLLALQILTKLANNHDNSGKIGNTRGLLSKVIELANASQYLLTNEHATESQIKTVRKALQVIKMLASTTGNTGKMLREVILDNVFAVSHMRRILQYGESHMDLQRLAIEILTNLAMDEASKERIMTAGGIIKLLLSIFMKPGIENQNSVSEEAGEGLAMLSLENQNNCALILREKGVVKKLISALSNQVLQLNASRILRNLCAYSRAESSNRLNGVIEAMPTVLKATMTQTDKLLEVSLGLTVQICKLLGPEDFAQEFEKADYTETGFVEKLIQILKQYNKHPEVKVPRIRSVGLSQHRESVSSLVEEALKLLTDGGSSQEV